MANMLILSLILSNFFHSDCTIINGMYKGVGGWEGGGGGWAAGGKLSPSLRHRQQYCVFISK